VACIGEGNNAVDVEAEGEAGGVCFAAPEKAAVEGFEDGAGIGAVSEWEGRVVVVDLGSGEL
jgi:hypothetical protein